MGLNDVLEEIRPGCTKRRRGRRPATVEPASPEDVPMPEEDVGDVKYPEGLHNTLCDPEPEPPKRKRKRTVATSRNSKKDEAVYTIQVIGNIDLPCHNLLPGEKLVVAKLSPLVISV